MRIVPCETGGREWNAFVEEHPCSSIFHLLEWQQIIARAYGHEPYYLMVEERGTVRGILPLFLIKSRLFGRALVSLPFTDYGGICADDPAAAAALFQEALKIGKTHQADYVQLRHRQPVPEVAGVAADKITMLLGLTGHPEAIWSRLPTERRNRIKKAKRLGVTGDLVGAEGLDQFYRVISRNMRDIGSPVHSREFFRGILADLGTRAKILLVQREEETIGAALCLFFRDTVYIPWVSSLRRHFALNPNMVLYWTAIEYACVHGYRTLDFGRSSRNAGTHEFKRQWGAVPLDLAWRSVALQGGEVPTFSGQGFRERIFVECWKRLPIGISRHLGPRVRGLIPA